MTEIYLLSANGENHPDVFIGNLSMGGYGLVYCARHDSYRLASDGFLDGMTETIKQMKLKPENIREDAVDLVENIVNSVVQEIEKLERNSHPKLLDKRINELIELVNTQN